MMLRVLVRRTYEAPGNSARANHRHRSFAAAAVAGLTIGVCGSALAQQVPTAPGPTNSPTSASAGAQTPAARQAYLASLLRDLDPCAGPLELDSKTGITPCVYVFGEAAVTLGYTSVSVPGSLAATGPRGGTAQLNFTGHFETYPGLEMEIGVTRHAQISIILPSAIDSNVPTSFASGGSSDAQLSYKQLVFANPRSGTLVSLAGVYEAPIGDAPFAATTPSYRAEAVVGKSLPMHFGLNAGLPLAYEAKPTLSQVRSTYGLTFTPSLVPYWQSPGGTFLGLIVTHEFSPDITPIAFSFLQLIGRHVQVGVAYGGLNVHSEATGPVPEVVDLRTSVSPRLLSLNVYFLAGKSDVPPALVQLRKAAALRAAQDRK